MVDEWGSEGRKPVVYAATPDDEIASLLRQSVAAVAPSKIDVVYNPLLEACHAYLINTSLRISHFVAQLAWESERFAVYAEEQSGQAYEGRKDLGNFQPGDGPKFKGHGWIMVTGRYNTLLTAEHFGFGDDVDRALAWLQTPDGAAKSSGFFWYNHCCNQFADADDIVSITRKINGALNGLDGRRALLAKINVALGRVA